MELIQLYAFDISEHLNQKFRIAFAH